MEILLKIRDNVNNNANLIRPAALVIKRFCDTDTQAAIRAFLLNFVYDSEKIAYHSLDERIRNYIDCIKSIYDMKEIFIKFKYMVENLNRINQELCSSVAGEGLEIKLLNNSVNKKTYNNVIDPMFIIYYKLC